MARNRSTAIIVLNNKILLMHRNNNGREYYAFIGGGIEQGETPEQAVLREVQEETSLSIEISKQLYEITRSNGEMHYVYLCTYKNGEAKIQKGTNEYNKNILGKNTYAPEWVDIFKLDSIDIYPDIIRHHVLSDIKNSFQNDTKYITTD